MRLTAVVMKRVISCLAIYVSTVGAGQVCARQPPDEAKLRQMMEQAQKVQECMARVDQSVLEKLRLEGAAMAEKVSALCAAGKREKAQSEAVAYSRKMAESPGLEQIRECSESMGDLDFGLSVPIPADIENSAHVCDTP